METCYWFWSVFLILCWTGCTCANSIMCSMSEELPLGTPVCNIGKKIGHENDGSATIQAMFKLMKINDHQYFNIDEDTGILRCRQRVDREKLSNCANKNYQDKCKLEINVAYFANKKSESSPDILDVNIQVKDINDHRPKFQSAGSTIQLAVKEHDRRAMIKLPSARDRDAGRNGTVIYQFPQNLKDTGVYKKFTMEYDITNGPHIRVVGDIDKEVTPGPFSLIVTASDRGNPPLSTNLTVILQITDTNDYAPIFQPLRENPIKVRESQPRGSTIAHLKATDKDTSRDIRYTLVHSDDANAFRIRVSTGELYLARELDAERRREYVLQVTATDSHADQPRTATTSLTIQVTDENDNDPEITVVSFKGGHRITVMENRPASYSVAFIKVEDKDVDIENSKVYCETGAFDRSTDAFKLESSDGQTIGPRLKFKLLTTRPLNREQRSRYDLSLTCRDSGERLDGKQRTKMFTVLVEDENDNGPSFSTSETVLSVRENMPIGTVVGSVTARDPDSGENGRIYYEMIPKYKHLVSVNKVNGQIKTQMIFDREKNASVVFEVRAYDAKLPKLNATQRVVLKIEDVNDNSPRFKNPGYTFYVPENQATREVGLLEAEDPDEGPNGKVNFVIAKVPSNNRMHWRLLKDGRLRLTTSHLDRERKALYHLVVEAYDEGRPSRTGTTTVTISVVDKNDMQPRFIFPTSGNSTVNVSINEKPGAVIAHITAVDDDEGRRGRIIYSIGQNKYACPQEDLFVLEPNTGLLKLVKTVPTGVRLDCRLTVKATDQGKVPRTGRAMLRIVFTGRGRAGRGGGRNGVPGKDSQSSGSREILIAFGIGLAILVLCCVFILLIYFCYYLQRTKCISCDQCFPGSMKGFSKSKQNNRAASKGVNLQPSEGDTFLKSTSGTSQQLYVGCSTDSGHGTLHVKPDNTTSKYYIADFCSDGNGSGYTRPMMVDHDSVIYSKIDSTDNTVCSSSGYGCLRETNLDHQNNGVIPDNSNLYCVYEHKKNRNIDGRSSSGTGATTLASPFKTFKPSSGAPLTDPTKRRNRHATLATVPTMTGPEGYGLTSRVTPDLALNHLHSNSSEEVKRIFQSSHQLASTDQTGDSDGASSGTNSSKVQRHAGYVYGSPYVTSSFV